MGRPHLRPSKYSQPWLSAWRGIKKTLEARRLNNNTEPSKCTLGGIAHLPQQTPWQAPVTITTADTREPEPDMIYTFWLTTLTALWTSGTTNEPDAPGMADWRLNSPDPQERTNPTTGQMTHLSTTWKLLPGIKAAKMSRYMGQQVNILHFKNKVFTELVIIWVQIPSVGNAASNMYDMESNIPQKRVYSL